MAEQLIIVGGGGYALSIADPSLLLGHDPPGHPAPENPLENRHIIRWFGGDCVLDKPNLRNVPLLNRLGSAGPTRKRRSRYLHGRCLSDVIGPGATVSRRKETPGDGHRILSRATIGAGLSIDEDVPIDTGASVDKGCTIAGHCRSASGAVICGDCVIGEAAHVGAGATVTQGVETESGAVIAAGAVVTRNVEPLTPLAGVPAPEL